MKLKSRLILQNIFILLGILLVTVCLSLLFTTVYSDINNETILPHAADIYTVVIENSDIVVNNSPMTDIEARDALMTAETGKSVYVSEYGTFTLRLSRDALFERVWGYDAISDATTVTVHIARIREKIELNSAHPTFIETVWGAGYRFKI